MKEEEKDPKIFFHDQPESASHREKNKEDQKTKQKSYEPVDESILLANVSDQIAKTDSLGFEPYVQAIADFLTHSRTEPPLTISIEGEWGTGKSSFMSQLEKKLKDKNELTVNFNAWRHDKEDALWAAFALEFIHQISRKRFFLRSWWGHLKLLYYRFSWKNGGLDILRSIAILIISISATVIVLLLLYMKGFEGVNFFSGKLTEYFGQNNNEISQVIANYLDYGGIAGAMGIVISIWIKLKNIAGNPLDMDINKYIQSPDYENRISFIENFHRDFNKIVDAYVAKEKVYVFIDDLDRCEAPKASDLMQAINLLISSDPRLIFIIGMDREKIAAGIAVKHKEVLPYLFSSKIDDCSSNSSEQNMRCIEYGYAFIEKFIQLPFLIPQPDKPEIQRFLFNISAKTDDIEKSNNITESIKKLIHKLYRSHYSNETQHPNSKQNLLSEQKENHQTIKFSFNKDSKTIHDIALMVSSALDNNPRHLKQFINLFRLRTFIANETGLFDVSEEAFSDEKLTLEQLGKFIAIYLKWPLLIEDLEKNRNLLAELQYLSIRRPFDDEKLIDSQIKLFSWNEIENIDKIRFIEYLSTSFGIYWIAEADFDYKINEIEASYGNNFLRFFLNNDPMNATNAYLHIKENTGKTQDAKFITKWETAKLNIYINISDKALYWRNQHKLIELLQSGEPNLINSPASAQGRKYNISKLNINKLLKTSPKVHHNESTLKRETFEETLNKQKTQNKDQTGTARIIPSTIAKTEESQQSTGDEHTEEVENDEDYARRIARWEERGPHAGPPP